MPGKRQSPEEIAAMLREADVRLRQGGTVCRICGAPAVSEHRNRRRYPEYGVLVEGRVEIS